MPQVRFTPDATTQPKSKVRFTPVQFTPDEPVPPPAPAPGMLGSIQNKITDYAVRSGQGFLEGAKGIAGMGIPQSIPQALGAAFLGPAGLITAQMIEGQLGQAQQASQAAEQGRTAEALGYSAGAAIPVVGPMLTHISERLGKRETPELAGELGAQLAFGALTGGAIKGEPVRTFRRGLRLDTKAKSQITKAFMPPVKDARWEQSLDRATPELAEQARISGGDPKNPIPSSWDLLGLLRGAKKRLWSEREKALAPYRPVIRVSAETVAKAYEEGITALLKETDPAAASTLQAKANSIRFESDGITRRTYPLRQAERMLKDVNTEVHKYYRKGPLEQLSVSDASELARLVRIGENVRGEIYSKAKAVGGGEVAELMRRYGALSDMELYADPLARHIQRYGGKDIAAMSTETLLDAAAGSIYSRSGGLIRGARGIKRITQKGPDELISAGFKRLGRYRPYTPVATGGPPQPGSPWQWSPLQKQLPRGAYQMPPASPSRGMQYEGQFPLEGQTAPKVAPKTLQEMFGSQPGGYVPPGPASSINIYSVLRDFLDRLKQTGQLPPTP